MKRIVLLPGHPPHAEDFTFKQLEPDYEELVAALSPIFGRRTYEHVSVWYEGHAADMFVDELGHPKGLQRNDAATKIYRAATLARQPGTDPESMPCIVGPAILFTERVWF